MPNFKIINDNSEINLNDEWIDSAKFSSKERIVDDKGEPVTSEYAGRKYQIISKKERRYTCSERIGRGLLGTIAVVVSLGFALICFNKTIRHLFTKEKANIRFAVTVKMDPKPEDKIPTPRDTTEPLPEENPEKEIEKKEEVKEEKEVKKEEPKKEVPPEIIEFRKIKDDKAEVAKKLDEIFERSAFFVTEEDKNLFTMMLEEMTAEEVATYVNESEHFKGLKNNDWVRDYKEVFYALTTDKHEAFVKLTLASAGKERVANLHNRLQSGTSSFTTHPNEESLKTLVNDFVESVKSREYLEEFKKSREFKRVGDVIARALKEWGKVFRLIAKEITEDELKNYVLKENDIFRLDDDSLSRWIPLNGLFEYLSIPKLKVFIGEALKRPSERAQKLFPRFIHLTSKLKGERQGKIFDFLLEWLMEDETRLYQIFPTLITYDYVVAFFGHYLAHIIKLEDKDISKYFEIAYTTNCDLFGETLAKGLKDKGLSSEEEDKIKRWFDSKKRKVPKGQVNTFSEEQLIKVFNELRNDPAIFKVVLQSINDEPFKVFAKAMTASEVALFASMENNCFDILPTDNHIIDSSRIDMVFNGFTDQEKLKALIESTIKRKDCLGKNGLYLSLLIKINNTEASIKESLLECFLKSLDDQKQLENFVEKWVSWNDGEGMKGQVVPAMKSFAEVYIAQGYNPNVYGITALQAWK